MNALRRGQHDRHARVEGACHHTDTREPALGVPIDQAAAMLPRDLLQGDEVIILLLKPSPFYIILACLGTLVAVAAIAALTLWIHERLNLGVINPHSVMTMATILIILRIFWQFLEWMSRTYVLTDRRVIRIRGVLRIEVFQAELHRIQHTEVIQLVRERFFGLGTISFSTAGTAFPEAYWLMLRQPYAVHQKILQTINRYR